MLKNKFSTVTNVFKAKSSTSAKTLSSGLFAAGTIGMARAVSKIDISSLRGNSEDEVTKQNLISLYDYISKVAQEENYNIYADNLDHIKSKISECKPKSISDLLADKFHQGGWNITSSNNSSLLTVAIERIRERQKGNKDCDIQMAVSLILGMSKELIIELENFADSNDKTLLHYLAESGKEDVLRFVIGNSNFDIEEAVRNKDRDGKTPLHYAAKSGNKECFEILMENEAHFTSTINYKSELHYAARSENFSLLKYLGEILKAKGIFDREKIKTDKYGNNALHYAAQSGDAKCIKFCIDNLVQFLKNQYNENPLHKIASTKGDQDNAINFLIEHLKLLGRLKSEINQEDVDGNTPLHIAAQYGNKQLIEVLCRLDAKIVKNKQDNTLLHIAIIHGNADCIELFIEKYENKGDSILESKGEHGRDLVHLAAMYGQFDCLDFLFKKFPYYDLNTMTEKGNTALHLALLSSTGTELRKKCVRLLIGRGVKIDESNNEGNTYLHFAAQLADLKFLNMIERELKKQKIDIYQEILRENQSGNTVFHMAVRVGNKSCLEHLFSFIRKKEIGEILDKKNEDGQTLLHLSMLNGSKECAQFLMQESQIDILSEQNTQKELLFAAALSGNKECLEFLVESLVGRNVADSAGVLFFHNDESDNTLLHMAALADGIECSQYIIESVSESNIRTLFHVNNHSLTPLHLAAMSLNVEVIEYFMTDSYPYTEKMLNVVSKSGRTPLHYLVMDDNDFERAVNMDFKQNKFLKSVTLEKRKQNEHLREKAISALFYLTMNNGEKIVNKKINFDIKDNAGKTALDYALEHSDANILKLFLDVFYEIKEDRKRKYDRFEIDYQEKREIVLCITGLLTPIAGVTISLCILSDQPDSEVKKAFTYVSILCSFISLVFFLSNLVVGRQKEPLKSDIENYTEKINRIEEVIGKSIKEAYDSEGYNVMLEQLAKSIEDTAQLQSKFNKFVNEIDLKNRDKLSISSQGMSRSGSAASARRSSSFLGNFGEKLGQYAKRNSKMQDTMDRHDSASCLITIDECSESNPKAPQSKFKTVVSKLKVSNIFGKKENIVNSSQSKFKTAVNKIKVTNILEKKDNLVDSLNLLGEKNTTKKDDEEKQPHSYSIFSNPF